MQDNFSKNDNSQTLALSVLSLTPKPYIYSIFFYATVFIATFTAE